MNIIWGKAVDFLVTVVGQSVVDRWQQNSAVDTSISLLQATLLKAHLLIERTECWRLPKYHPIDELLPHLKDDVYEAESIVDELEYQRLKNEVEYSLPGITMNFLMNWMNNFPRTVERVLDRLNNLYNEMKETCDSRGIPENPNQFSETARPVTSTFVDASKVYGREKELKDVIRLLRVSNSRSGCNKRAKKQQLSNLSIGESSNSINNKGNVSVLSIVGMGGVGKTTLAQMVCNERSVESHFGLIMWVCVSDNFDLIRLTKEIIESATKKDCNLTNLHALQVDLQEKLNSNRFLLVLDDVWSRDWQSLLAPMKSAEEGSVVMVTTRSLDCVDISGTSIDSKGVINLEGLEEDIYWDFFKSCAFGSVENANNYKELKIIGQEICNRLKGSPLAAKTIGGLLRTSMDERHWRNIKDSKIWQLQQEERDILPVLQLSYQYLPSPLKKCFSFCSLYPKDFKFTKWELTKLWIMEGFINLQQLEIHCEEPYIKEAEDCFNDLVQRCFFQKASRSGTDKYVIHDLMHDACQSITKSQCFCIEDANFENNDISNIRHCSIFWKGLKQKEQEKLSKYEKLISVRVMHQNSCCSTALNKWCGKLTNIRSLSLSRWKYESLPKSIGNLKHLKYLDISSSNVENFPESFGGLYNLLYLNMENCWEFKFFPEGFKKLVNLRFLYLPKSKLILLGNMENFARKIDCKDMSFECSTYGKIENLKFMNDLRDSLTIRNLELVPSKPTAEEAHLNNKHLINSLRLYWSENKHPTGDQPLRVERRDEEVLQGLFPHPNLKELEIRGYAGRNLSPSWLTEHFLPNLTAVRFSSCISKTISYIPCLITYICIMDCPQLTDLQNCLGPNHLPGLQKLEIIRCLELVSIAVDLFGEFVSLENLNIYGCPKLTCPNAMVLLPSMKNLELTHCGDIVKSIPSFLQNLTSLENLHIAHCRNLLSIPAEATRNLKSLRRISIESCAALDSIGGLEFLVSLQTLIIRRCSSIQVVAVNNLKSLSHLDILDCAKLQSLGGLLYLTSVKYIVIWGCPNLQETRSQNVRGSLPAEILAELPSSSSGGKTKIKRART